MREKATESNQQVDQSRQDLHNVVDGKPFKVSPFQVSYGANKMDYVLARLDDLMNFVRRVRLK